MKADVHSHILPGIDDGAPNAEHSREALRVQKSLGITHLALTPHFYPFLSSLDDFLESRRIAYTKFLSLPETKEFHLSLGAEVYFTEAVLNCRDLRPLCYSGTSVMLTELETKDKFSPQMDQDLFRLIEERQITPLLAHIDRYSFLINDKQLLHYLKDMGCYFQINLDSFLYFSVRKKVFSWMEEDPDLVLGQDVHTLPITGKYREKIMKKIHKHNESFISVADRNAIRMIFPSKEN